VTGKIDESKRVRACVKKNWSLKIEELLSVKLLSCLELYLSEDCHQICAPPAGCGAYAGTSERKRPEDA
jgi:hypothetical protein